MNYLPLSTLATAEPHPGNCPDCGCGRYAEHSRTCTFRQDCPGCGRGFSSLSDLVDHIGISHSRILEGCVCMIERPWSCSTEFVSGSTFDIYSE